MSTYKFTAMKKSNKVKAKGGDGTVQPTLFQTWGAKNTASTSNFNNEATVIDDITMISDEEDDNILVQALESSQGGAMSSPGKPAIHSVAGASDIESDGDIDFENIPDLPGFNKFAGRLWIYPTNYPVRQYQFDITKEALFKNTLVVLPTGLGKTFIAAVVMYNFYRWYSSGKVVFMAPTKPLVAQQIEACYNIMGIPQADMSEMTGKMLPKSRKEMWKEKRIIFLTPQVLVNDLTRGTCQSELIKCVIVDEAHKSLGNYAYCQVIRELVKKTKDFRVLALSATPGNNLKMVQEVLTNLLISHVAIRTEDSPDVKIYSNERKIEKIIISLGSEIDAIQKKYVEVLESVMNRLICRRLLHNVTVHTVSKFTALKARDLFRQKPPQNLSPSIMGNIEGDFGLLISLCHGHELLQLHGLRSFYQYIANMMDNGSGRSRQELLKNPAFIKIYEQLEKQYGGQNISFTQMSTQEKTVPYVLGHPKLEKLLEIVVGHFKNFQEVNGNLETRVMIFSQYRNSVTDIAEMLKRERPLIKAMSFIGQSVGKNTKGFTQKEQIKVMKDFREGGYNTLIATCVGEEGLDIGDVDLIICFDTCKSPVRFVQRMGRTGRKRSGKIIMLITKGREEQMYKQAQYQWNSLNKSLSKGCKQLVFYSDHPNVIPEGLVPRCQKINITVKESFQSIHCPKQKKPKKSPKKRKKSTKKDNQDISLFTTPALPTVDPHLQPTTSRVHLVNEPGLGRIYSLLSDDDDDCELPDLVFTNFKLKEKLFGKKTTETSETETKTTSEKSKKKSKKVVGKSKNQAGKTKKTKKKTKKKEGAEEQSFSGDEIFNVGAESSARFRFGDSSKKNCSEYCSESVSDLLSNRETNCEVSREALDNANPFVADVPLSPNISSNGEASLQVSKVETSLHGSMVPAAPDVETVSNLIDDFGNVLSSQSTGLDLERLTNKWDEEFDGLVQGGAKVKSSKTPETVKETPLKGPLADTGNICRKRKLENHETDDVMTDSERLENIPIFVLNKSDERVEKTAKSDELKISDETSPKSATKCHLNLSSLNLSEENLFSDSSLFINDEFNNSDEMVNLLLPQGTNATNTKLRIRTNSNTSRPSNMSSTTSPVDTTNQTKPPNTSKTSITTTTTRPVDTSNRTRPVDTSITTTTTRPVDTNNTTRPVDTSITTITTRPVDKNNTPSKPNQVFRYEEPFNNQVNKDNKVAANNKNLNLDMSLSVSKQPTSKSFLECYEDNGGEVGDGICFDLTADMFSDIDVDDDFSKEKNGNNSSNSKPGMSSRSLNDDQNKCIREPAVSGKETGPCKRVSGDGEIETSLGCKLSSLINSHATIKDSLTTANKLSEDFLNFDLGFGSDDDDLFKSVDNTDQQFDSVFEDDAPEFNLQFDFDDSSPLPENGSCSLQGNQSKAIFGANNTTNSRKSQPEEPSQDTTCSNTVPFQNYNSNSTQNGEITINKRAEMKNSKTVNERSFRNSESPFQGTSSRINMSHGPSGNVTPEPCGKVTPKPVKKFSSYSDSFHGSEKSRPTTTVSTTTTNTSDVVVVDDGDDVVVIDDADDDDDDDEVIIKPKKRAVVFSPSSDGSTPRSEVKGCRLTNLSTPGILSSDLDSPVITRRMVNKRCTERRRQIIEDESNDSDFENDLQTRLAKYEFSSKRSTPKPVVVSQPKRRKIHRKNVNSGRQFLDEEAVQSGSDMESSNDEETFNDLDNYENSFIDDNYTLGKTQDDMKTVYLKSVRSPVYKPNAYKLQYRPHALDVFSQNSEPDVDCYEDDSFLDDSSEISVANETANGNDTDEIVLMTKSKSKDSNKKRIIRCLQSTSEEEEEQEVDRFALNLDMEEKCPKATNVPLKKPPTCKTGSFKSSEPETRELTLFADSREISGAQEILSNLRSKFNINVVVTKLSGSDYLVSLRTGVERIYLSEFSNFSNNRKITERLQQLIDLHDRPCVIVEKKPVKKGLANTKTPFYQTKYLEKLLSRISLSPIKLLFSENKDETCSLLAKLCCQEAIRNFAIADHTLSLTEEQRLKFLLSLPQLNYALALNLCKAYKSMKQFLTSSAEEIARKGKMSAVVANQIYEYIHRQTFQDL